MEWIHTEEKSGYSIMQNNNDEQYIVIDGLNPDYVHTPGMIETFLTQHYSLFAVGYWILLAVIFAYIILRYIILPLRERLMGGRPLFSDE